MAWPLLFAALAGMVVGGVGVYVLLDTEQTGPLAQSALGTLLRRLVMKNPFYLTIFFNGSLIMAALTGTQLQAHYK